MPTKIRPFWRRPLEGFRGPAGRRAVAALSVALFTSWMLAPAGIIELGRKGKKPKGSFTQIVVEGTSFIRVHDPNDTADGILEDLRGQIDLKPRYNATTVNDTSDPNRNAIKVTLDGSGEDPLRIALYENDEYFQRTGLTFAQPSFIRQFTFLGVDDPNGTGGDYVRLDVTTTNGVKSSVVTTAGKNAVQVNAELRAQLEGHGFSVTEWIGNEGIVEFSVNTSGEEFLKVLYTHTDPGVTRSKLVGQRPVRYIIPTLSGWGLALLAVLMAAAAAFVLRRRRGSDTA